MIGVYAITCTPTGEQYIGSSWTDVEHRWRAHRWGLLAGHHHAKRLQAAFDRYGMEALNFAVLEECDPATDDPAACVRREQYWIDRLRPVLNTLPYARLSIPCYMRDTAPDMTTRSMHVSGHPLHTLTEARVRAHLRAVDVASRTGAAISTIRNIEAGRQSPSINLAQKIADALGLDVGAIDWRTLKDKEREEVSESEPQDQPQAEH